MTHDELLEAVKAEPRILIVGGPDTGKSNLALALAARPDTVSLPVHHVRQSDALIESHDWSEASLEVAGWIDQPGPWIIEGVATARALRKWLRLHPGEKLDVAIVLTERPLAQRSKGQAAMGKGVATVWNEIASQVLARGARVLKYDGPTPEQIRGEAAGAPAPGPDAVGP